MSTVLITVEGGVVTDVGSDDPFVRVYLRDWDVAEEKGLDKPEVIELEVHRQIKVTQDVVSLLEDPDDFTEEHE